MNTDPKDLEEKDGFVLQPIFAVKDAVKRYDKPYPYPEPQEIRGEEPIRPDGRSAIYYGLDF